MKKLGLLVAIFGLAILTSCGGAETEQTQEQVQEQVVQQPVQEVAADTTATDTTTAE